MYVELNPRYGDPYGIDDDTEPEQEAVLILNPPISRLI
jgi:hypothetical protein